MCILAPIFIPFVNSQTVRKHNRALLLISAVIVAAPTVISTVVHNYGSAIAVIQWISVGSVGQADIHDDLPSLSLLLLNRRLQFRRFFRDNSCW